MNIHKFFIFTIFLLTGFGLIMVASASGYQSQYSFGSSSYLFFLQFFRGFGIGIIGFTLGYFIKPSLVKRLSLPFVLASIILLGTVLLPGIGIEYGGSRRWLSIGGLSFQPSELGKIALLFYSSSWLASRKEDVRSFRKGFLPFLVLSVPIPLLILLEPNISNFGISFALILVLLFSAGARVWHLMGLALTVIFLSLLSLIFLPQRLERILTFINPHIDPQGSSYQINQSLTAIGSGGLEGKGLGESTQKLGILPEPSGDAIFAVIAEEFGFIGAGLVVLTYLLFVLEGIIIALQNSDAFSRYVALGFSSLVALQAFINVSAVSGLVPLTGVTLPFISYGGTSLAVFLTASGVVARMARRVS